MNNFRLSGFISGNDKVSSSNISYLHNWIKMNGTIKIAEAGATPFRSSNNSIFSIESGVWRLLIGDRKVIGIVGSGGVVLLNKSTQNYNNPPNKCEIVSRSVYYELPEECIHLAAADKSLLKGILDFMKLNASNISNKWLGQCMNDGYAEVKYALEWMDVLPETVKTKFTAISFITDTTGVSRSHALSIMKSLKQGGYIEVDGGYLVHIIKNYLMAIRLDRISMEIYIFCNTGSLKKRWIIKYILHLLEVPSRHYNNSV